MINHAEAQSLVSARQDAPLDPIVARELDAHLATCPQCRAFAASTVAMTRALQELPHLPPSAQVRRNVMEAIQKPVSPWNRVQGYFAPSQGFAWSTIAAVALVAVLSIVVFTRLLNNPDQGPDTNLLQAPSVSATATVAPTHQSDVAQLDLTPTEAPTQQTDAAQRELTPTKLPVEPTATEAPAEPTATKAAPTDTPSEVPTEVPTATERAMEPTEQAALVEPTQPEPTATATEGNQTAIRIGDKTPEPTDVPTDMPVQPTETPVPATEILTDTPVVATEPPTEEPIPPTDVPTDTPEPTAVEIATATTTSTPQEAPTDESPPIEPVNGTYEASDGTDGVSPTVVETMEPAETETVTQPIFPMSTPNAEEPTIGPADTHDGQTHTPSSESLNGGPSNDPGTTLGAIDPGTQITGDGASWAPYALTPVPMQSPSGLTVGERAGVIAICSADGTCQPLDKMGNRRDASTDTAIGWIGDTLIVEHVTSGDQATYSAYTLFSDGSVSGEVVLGESSASAGNTYVFGDGLLIETKSGWFTAYETYGVAVDSGAPGGSRNVVRLYPDYGVVGFITDGRIVFEDVNSGGVLGEIDTASVTDFDLLGDSTVVVSTGTSIEVWDLGSGSPSMTFTPPSGDGIGSVAWLADGSIAYVDTSTGEVRSITPDEFGASH